MRRPHNRHLINFIPNKMLDEEQPSKRQQQGWRSRVENHKKLPIHLNWLSFASWTLLVYQCFYDISIGYQGKRSPIPILQLFYVHPHYSWGQKSGAMGFHRRTIGDSLPRHWGFTSSLLGRHPSRYPLTNVCVWKESIRELTSGLESVSTCLSH